MMVSTFNMHVYYSIYNCPSLYYIEIWHCGVCLSTYDTSEEDWWVECDKCSCWYHSKCVNLRRNPGARRWFCPACKRHQFQCIAIYLRCFLELCSAIATYTMLLLQHILFTHLYHKSSTCASSQLHFGFAVSLNVNQILQNTEIEQQNKALLQLTRASIHITIIQK